MAASAKIFSLICLLLACSLISESAAQYYSPYGSYYGGYGYGYPSAYGGYGGYGYGYGYPYYSAYGGYYGKREAGFGPQQTENQKN